MSHKIEGTDYTYLKAFSISEIIASNTGAGKKLKFTAYVSGSPDKIFLVLYTNDKTGVPDAEAFYSFDEAIEFYNKL
jgi:hypothetical protein